jgi:hypothetical protein
VGYLFHPYSLLVSANTAMLQRTARSARSPAHGGTGDKVLGFVVLVLAPWQELTPVVVEVETSPAYLATQSSPSGRKLVDDMAEWVGEFVT